MLETLTWEEFNGWMTYYSIEPWGEQRADLRHGINTSALVNVHITEKSSMTKATDFMPFYDRSEEGDSQRPATVEQFEAAKAALRRGPEAATNLAPVECVVEETEVVIEIES